MIQDVAQPKTNKGREILSEARRPEAAAPAALLVEPIGACAVTVRRAHRPALRELIWVSNGYGERIRAEVMTAVHPCTMEFGVRVFGWKVAGPWDWFAIASCGLTWWPLGEG